MTADPERREYVAALEAVAVAAQAALWVDPTTRAGAEVHGRLEDALDAVPAPGTTEVEKGLPRDDQGLPRRPRL